MQPSVLFTVGDFNRTNVRGPQALCASTERRNDVVMAQPGPGYQISNLECGTVLRSEPRQGRPNRTRRLFRQHELEAQFRQKLQEEDYDQDINYHPSDHAPLHMEFTLSKGQERVHMGILTWNTMASGIAPGAPRGWPIRLTRLDQADKMLKYLSALLTGATQNRVPIVCLQEFGGELWGEYLAPHALTARFAMGGLPQRFAMGPKSLDSGELPSLASVPEQWLMFRTNIGKVTLIKASAIDQSRVGSKANHLTRSNQLEAGLPNISTSMEIALLIENVPLLVRITNVHDTARLAGYPGFTNSLVQRSLMAGGRSTKKLRGRRTRKLSHSRRANS